MDWVNPLDRYQWGTPEDPNAFTHKDYDRAIAGGLNALDIAHYTKLGNNGVPYNVGPNAKIKIDEGLKANPLWSFSGYDKDPRFFGWEAYQKALRGGLTPLDIAWNLNKAGLRLDPSAETAITRDLDVWEGYKGQLDTRNQEYLNLSGQYGSLQGNYNTLGAKYSGLEQQYKGAQDQYNSLNNQYSALNNQYSAQGKELSQLQGGYTDLQGRYGTLEAQYRQQGSDYTNLKTDYGSLQGRYEDLQRSYGSTGLEYGTLKNDYSSLQNRYADLEGRYGTLKSESGQYLSDIENYKKQTFNYQNQLSSAGTRIAGLETQVGDLNNLSTRYKLESEANRDKANKYEADLFGANQRIGVYERDIGDYQKRIGGLEGDLSNYRTQFETAKINYEKTLAQRQLDYDLLNSNYTIAQAERERLNQDVNRYREEAISQQISGLRAGDNRGNTPAVTGSESLTPGGAQVRTGGGSGGTVVDVRDELSDTNSVVNRRGPVVQALSSATSRTPTAGRASGAQAPALASGVGQYYTRRFG